MRDKYIFMRNSQKLNNTWLWEYYKEQGGKINDPQEFLEHFYYETTPIIVNGRSFGQQKIDRDLSNFFNDMDKVFNLTTLWGTDGTFLKVVE
jgi:hypothetical protein